MHESHSGTPVLPVADAAGAGAVAAGAVAAGAAAVGGADVSFGFSVDSLLHPAIASANAVTYAIDTMRFVMGPPLANSTSSGITTCHRPQPMSGSCGERSTICAGAPASLLRILQLLAKLLRG